MAVERDIDALFKMCNDLRKEVEVEVFVYKTRQDMVWVINTLHAKQMAVYFSRILHKNFLN